ncbi:hypothetical protein CASFOL_003861 [Castilleja foliolosa]|uniref:Actin cross-linking n=1 Tax=Castilleja foliolosa TaxID=1961234 RepID=A0ABD3EIE0_9LAMI
MEFFNKTKAVRLKSHLNKYLYADDNQITTRQRGSGPARKSRWLVELVDGDRHIIRLKSCHNRYLAASDEPSLLGGVTGRKIIQTHRKDYKIDWQPIRDGFQVKLRSYGGTYLRANGGTPPFRNTVTHDRPRAAATRDWIVWDVEVAECNNLTLFSSFSSVSNEISNLGFEFGFGSPIFLQSGFSGLDPFSPRLSMIKSPLISIPRKTTMDLFQKAKTIRLKSAHNKYLIADEDEKSVTQDLNGSSRDSKWAVEFVENSVNIIRLRSCYGKYLTASNQPFLQGMTGRKVLQTVPKRLDRSVEWEVVWENGVVKLKTRYGRFLRANGGLHPWRNSVTHDLPHGTEKEWVVWEVDVVRTEEVLESSEARNVVSCPGYCSPTPASFPRAQESNDSYVCSSPKGSDGRLIYYRVADENGKIDEGFDELCITFKGNEVNELTLRLEEELGLDNVNVCVRSPLDDKLYPLRLQLPPNNATMHVVVVPQRRRFRWKSDASAILMIR